MTLEILPRYSAVDQRNLAIQRAKVSNSVRYVEDIKEEKDRQYVLVRSE